MSFIRALFVTHENMGEEVNLKQSILVSWIIDKGKLKLCSIINILCKMCKSNHPALGRNILSNFEYSLRVSWKHGSSVQITQVCVIPGHLDCYDRPLPTSFKMKWQGHCKVFLLSQKMLPVTWRSRSFQTFWHKRLYIYIYIIILKKCLVVYVSHTET